MISDIKRHASGLSDAYQTSMTLAVSARPRYSGPKPKTTLAASSNGMVFWLRAHNLCLQKRQFAINARAINYLYFGSRNCLTTAVNTGDYQ